MVAEDSRTGVSRPAAAGRPAPDGSGRARRGLWGSLGLFLRQILDELRKVVRPTRHEWQTYTAVVIAFVVAIMLFVFGLDQVFTRLVFFVFAGSGS